MIGKLYIVATPIGNLEDLSFRALRILQESDFILCEDTRTAEHLLKAYDFRKPLISFYHHSPASKYVEIKNLLLDGKIVSLVSEAGTPGISDPGNLLINYLHQENVCAEIIPIPGPCAAIAALSAAGFSADRFLFLGFLPTKNKRKKFLARISENMETTVFYESPYRILKTLEELTATIEDQNRRIFVGRELTKKFETSYRGTFQDIIAQVKTHPIKGEFVVVVEGRSSAASLV